MTERAASVQPERFLDLVERELEPQPCWIEPSILTKSGLLLFGGLEKIGKSLIMLEFARALATATRPFGCPFMKVEQQAKILLVEQEVGPIGLQKRVKKILADEDKSRYGDKMFYVSHVPEMQLDSLEGRRCLFNLVEQVEPDVLLLDPIGKMHGYDENSNTQIGQLFNHLDALKGSFKDRKMSIVIAHHFGKPAMDPEKGRDPLDARNFRGSSHWTGDPDTLITVNRLGDLGLPWKAWRMQMRFTLRHDECPDDIFCTANERNDLRVRYEKSTGPAPKLTPETTSHKKEPQVGPPVQGKLFRPA